MSILVRTTILLSLALSLGCGSAVEKSPKKGANNTVSNNAATNNAATNNAATNNTATNNTATNNTATNNTTANNDAPCVGVEPASVNFGAVVLGAQATAEVLVSNCSTTVDLSIDGASSGDGFDVLLPDVASLPPRTAVAVTLVFEPSDAVDYSGQASIVTSAGPVVVSLVGSGQRAIEACPTTIARARVEASQPWVDSVTTTVAKTVMLTAAQSTAGEPILGYQWTILSRPGGSTARLNPDAMAESPSIYLDVAGVYEIDLHVDTANSPDDCPGARVTLNATSAIDPDALVISLTWNTPTDADQTDNIGTDLDLHYKTLGGVWNTAPYDCYWQNPEPNWGADGAPKVDRDDIDGAGPEIITHSNAAPNGQYGIGAYYYSDSGFGSSDATIRIHIAGVLQFERQYAAMVQGQFWYMGDYVTAISSLSVEDTVTTGFPP